MNKISIPGLKTKTGFAVAGLIIMLELSGLYMYFNNSPAKLFSKNYHPYQPHITRGISGGSSTKNAYSDGNMDSVISAFNKDNAPVPEEYLLAGIAFLEKNQPTKAIETFQQLIQRNAEAKTDFFEEDAEYYLAMSYLSNNETEKAMPIFEKIQSDPEHPYNSQVSDWFVLNIKTLIAKK
jgi:tetratricopeptide (TPR) repeat protein